MIVDLDIKHMKQLLLGCMPELRVKYPPLLEKHGYIQGGHNDTWIWRQSINELSIEEMWQLIKMCTYCKNVLS